MDAKLRNALCREVVLCCKRGLIRPFRYFVSGSSWLEAIEWWRTIKFLVYFIGGSETIALGIFLENERLNCSLMTTLYTSIVDVSY